MKLSFGEPDAKISPRTLPVDVHPQAASSSFETQASQPSPSQNRTGIGSSLRDRASQPEDIFLISLLLPFQKEDAGGPADEPDPQSIHTLRISNQSPSIEQNTPSGSDTSYFGDQWHESERHRGRQ